MNDLKILFEKVLEVKEKYDNERAKKRFNIFTALHKERDEVNLHSRTITYLLSPDSGHGMKSKFAEIFIRNILEIPNEIFSLEGLEVFPSENSKSEYKEIDILLINRQRKQAIIIENKIDAKDSNHEGDDVLHGYSGQLERYYNTIKTGLDKNNNKIWDFQCNTVSVYYLTLYKQPSKESIGNLKKVRILYYKDEIRKWLTECVKEKSNNPQVREFIQQYLDLINKMTNNDISIDERVELKNSISLNWENAMYLFNNFKHIKWHTLYDFWVGLRDEANEYFQNAVLYPDSNEFVDSLTSISHNNKNCNHGVVFEDSTGKKIYVSGMDALSWGIVEPKSWLDFKDEELQGIVFSTFNTKNSWRLIDKNNMKKAIGKIINEIREEQINNYCRMHFE